MTTETIRFPVHGMICGSCVNTIMRALRKLDGVEKVAVDLRRETATITRDPTVVSNATIAVAIEGAGYEPEVGAAVVLAPVSGPTGILARLRLRLS